MRFLRIFAPALLLALGACGGSGDSPGTPTSAPVRTSHNAGRDCLQCHGFSVAGTVYRADGSVYPEAVGRLTSQPSGVGQVPLSVTADASGNFYTNETSP